MILKKVKSVYFVVLGEHTRYGSNVLSIVNGRFGVCQVSVASKFLFILRAVKRLFTKFFNTIGNMNLTQARVSECVLADPLQ